MALTAFEKVILKMEEAQMKHGGTSPLEKHQEELKYKKQDLAFNEMIQKILPTETDRNKMINACDTLLERLEDKCEMLIQKPDGTYIEEDKYREAENSNDFNLL